MLKFKSRRLFNKGTISLVSALYCLSSMANVGPGSSGGGGSPSSEIDSAWFLGNRTIRYCIVSQEEKTFSGVFIPELPGLIDEVFKKWRDYIEYKSLKSSTEYQLLVLNSKFINCDGTEDLKFYFGVEDTQVKEAKKLYQDPISLAYRTEYNVTEGWGKGFIWISELKEIYPSITPEKLRTVILHEIGHTLGNSHIEGTVMTGSLRDGLTSPTWGIDSKYLSKIDWTAELYEDYHAHPKVGKMSSDPNNIETAANFKRIVGRDPVGEVKVVFFPLEDQNGTRHLVFEDRIGTKDVHLRFDPASLQNQSFRRRTIDSIFKIALLPPHQGDVSGRFYSGYVMGNIEASDGSLLPVMVENNLGDPWTNTAAPYQIKFWENGHKHDIFAQTQTQ